MVGIRERRPALDVEAVDRGVQHRRQVTADLLQGAAHSTRRERHIADDARVTWIVLGPEPQPEVRVAKRICADSRSLRKRIKGTRRSGSVRSPRASPARPRIASGSAPRSRK